MNAIMDSLPRHRPADVDEQADHCGPCAFQPGMADFEGRDPLIQLADLDQLAFNPPQHDENFAMFIHSVLSCSLSVGPTVCVLKVRRWRDLFTGKRSPHPAGSNPDVGARFSRSRAAIAAGLPAGRADCRRPRRLKAGADTAPPKCTAQY